MASFRKVPLLVEGNLILFAACHKARYLPGPVIHDVDCTVGISTDSSVTSGTVLVIMMNGISSASGGCWVHTALGNVFQGRIMCSNIAICGILGFLSHYTSDAIRSC